MSIERDKNLESALKMTRRDFMTISTMASVCALSERGLPEPASHTDDRAPFFAEVVTLDEWTGETALLQRIRRSLFTRSTDVFILCAASPRHIDSLLDARGRTNTLYGLRKLLVHRPLNFNSLTRTLEQIHSDSEGCLVDGWEISTDSANQSRELTRCIGLTLNLISRTHSPVISLVPPASGVWDVSALATVSGLSSVFPDLKFVMLRGQELFQMSPGQCSVNLADAMRTAVLSANVYFPSGAPGLNVAWGINSSRILYGHSYLDNRRSVFTGPSRSSGDLGYLGLNAASIYSLRPSHYRAAP
jgi:hypothetical protein